MTRWVLTAVLVCASLLIHEFAHVFAIRFMGGKVEKVGFFPLGMMAKARRLETLHAWERYIIYAAGPAANFLIAMWAFGTSFISYTGVAWLDSLAFYSFILGIFNLTPVLPMDGGRITWQFLGNRIGMLRASRFIKRLGIFVSIIYLALGVVQVILFPFNITLLLAAIFLWQKNRKISPELQTAFHQALDGKNHPNRARTLATKEISLPENTPVKKALERLAGDYFITFYIEGNKKRPLREKTLINRIFTHGIGGTVGEFA